jgi:hypothetical protein
MALCTNQQMGLGPLGSDGLVFKRKYRWTFAITPYCGTQSIPVYFVKLASRPNLTIEETEINFLHGKMWIPGKGSWETITVTFYDVGGPAAGVGMLPLFNWLATVYNFTDPTCLSQSSRIGTPGSGGYSATGVLQLFDGCGTTMETWTLQNMWPQAINFGELDYSSSEEVTIELTLRYAQVTFVPGCGIKQLNPCCQGC